MLKSINAEYVIIGHSERRQYFGETDEIVNLKLKASLKEGLKPIVCVGETLEEREEGNAKEVITKQVEEALKGLNKEELLNTIIAYEPIWAIGTGKTATAEDAKELFSMSDIDGGLVGGASLKPEVFEKIVNYDK